MIVIQTLYVYFCLHQNKSVIKLNITIQGIFCQDVLWNNYLRGLQKASVKNTQMHNEYSVVKKLQSCPVFFIMSFVDIIC